MRWLGACGALAALGVLLWPLPAQAEAFDLITRKAPSAGITLWRIDKPNVKQKMTEYKQIRFRPGDRVTIQAGGCVQTGGLGKTWKRYVDPQGPNSDRLYHGLIWIPGATKGLVRLQGEVKTTDGMKTYTIPKTAKEDDLYLRLGYEDDNHSDNGYWGRDEGTGNQCKGHGNAYVVVIVQASGAGPVPVGLIEPRIRPAYFLSRGAWALDNFKTSTLSFETFQEAFDLGPFDYLNPITYALYFGARGRLAARGNCFGMCLLAAEIEADTQLPVPFSGELHEDVWAQYRTLTPRLGQDINTGHWKQVSTGFLKQFLHQPPPGDMARQIDADLKLNRYGLLSITHGLSRGHVMIPLSVVHGREADGTETHTIYLYDPNRPYRGQEGKSTTADMGVVTVRGRSWAFPRGDTTWTDRDGGLHYIRPIGASGWRDLPNGPGSVLTIVLGEGASLAQVTDGSGKRLFTVSPPRSLAHLDRTASGLGRDIVRLVPHADGPGKPLPKAVSGKAKALSPIARTMLARYAGSYGAPGEIYFIFNPKLEGLKLQVVPAKQGGPVAVMVGNNRELYEVKLTGARAPEIHLPSVSRLAAGAHIRDQRATAARALVSHGRLATEARELHVQEARGLRVGPGLLRVSLTATGALKVQGSPDVKALTVHRLAIDDRGVTKALATKKGPAKKIGKRP
jgi:hypothetical protein